MTGGQRESREGAGDAARVGHGRLLLGPSAAIPQAGQVSSQLTQSMAAPPAQVLSVTDLTRRVKDVLEERFPSVWVEGEVSNLRSPSSGHVYFTLKDSNAQLAAVLFRGVATKVGFTLKDGLQVIALGDVSVYEKSGQRSEERRVGKECR